MNNEQIDIVHRLLESSLYDDLRSCVREKEPFAVVVEPSKNICAVRIISLRRTIGTMLHWKSKPCKVRYSAEDCSSIEEIITMSEGM